MNAPTQAEAPVRAKSTTILLVDPDPLRLRLSSARVQHAGHFVETATDAQEGLLKAKLIRPDAVLCELTLDGCDGFSFCRSIREQLSLASVPVLLLTSHTHEPADHALAEQIGASSLVHRTNDFAEELSALRTSLDRREIKSTSTSAAAMYEEHLRSNATQLVRLLAETRESKDRYRALFDEAVDVICLLTLDGVVVDVNRRWANLLGRSAEGFEKLHIHDFASEGEQSGEFESSTSTAPSQVQRRIVPIRAPSGSILQMEFSTSIVDIDGCSLVLAIGRDITQQVQTRRALEVAERKYRTIVERIPDVLWTRKASGLSDITQNIENLLGYTADEALHGGNAFWTERTHINDRQMTEEAVDTLLRDGTMFDIEYRFKHKDGEWRWLRSRSFACYEHGGEQYFEGVVTDITARHLQEQSARQAQKMEAIGQLTSGIAHDFNNMLAVVMANAHFIAKELTPGDPKRPDLDEITKAVERAAALTRQLLAFSRRQLLDPRVLDLNVTIANVQKMLKQVVREDIEFQVIEGKQLHAVRADVGQIEQVVTNLVVNARDAMPNGGKLVMATANETVQAGRSDRSAMPPGEYVVITVSDNGMGMSEDTIARLYEPFFTTKPIGKGTGLGLATCYGIVKQSGGYIWVTSELGHGTTFAVYLPRVDEKPAPQAKPVAVYEDLRGTETILLLEDDSRVRSALGRVLESHGYKVIFANESSDALRLAKQHSETIHAVVSDVIMPGGSGPDAVAQLRTLVPNLPALYVSGYTDHRAFNKNGAYAHCHFLQKPFSPDTLARKMREMLKEAALSA